MQNGEWDSVYLRKVRRIMASRVMLYLVRVSAYCRQYIGACELSQGFQPVEDRYDTIRYDMIGSQPPVAVGDIDQPSVTDNWLLLDAARGRSPWYIDLY